MPDFGALGANIGNIFDVLAERAREERLQKMQMEQMFNKALMEAQIKQMFPDPYREIQKSLAVTNLLRNYRDLGIPIGSMGGVAPSTLPISPASSDMLPIAREPQIAPDIIDLHRRAQYVQGVKERPAEAIDIMPDRVTTTYERPDLYPTKFEKDVFGRWRPTQVTSAKAQRREKITSEAVKASGKQIEDFLKAQRNLSRITSASRGLVATAKQAVKEMGGFGAKQYYGARFKQFLAKSGFVDLPLEEQQSGLSSFRGQLKEMVLALSPILTNQNRIIERVVEMLSETLPKFPTSEANFTAQLKQTVKNAFRLSIALSKGLLSPTEIEALSQADPEVIDSTLKKLLDKTQFTSEDEKWFRKYWQRIKNTPAAKAEGLFTKQQEQPFKFGRFPTTQKQVKQFVDDDGNLYSVPINEVDSFLQEARQEDINIRELQ